MRIPKKYGDYKLSKCPFCEKTAITKNSQKVPVCIKHKNNTLNNLICDCGQFLELKISKYGPYFYCYNCGNKKFDEIISLNRFVIK